MAATDASRILLCATDPTAVADLRTILESAGHATDWHAIANGGPDDVTSYQLVVLEGTRGRDEALGFCRGLRQRLADAFVPVLFVAGDLDPEARLASLQEGADTYLLRPFSAGELIAQAKAFLRVKEVHDRLIDKTTEAQRINKRLQAAYQQIDDELELARRVQHSFLPAALPEIPGARLAVHYRPCGRVGGDFYDAFRLDEGHLGLYVADAMGHGVPASLLTIFLKSGVRAKEIFGRQYRLVPPGEVLQRLNRDLIGQQLPDQPFITMVYGLLDLRERTFVFARAGHPHPLYVPAKGEPAFWQVTGPLLGIFDGEFLPQTRPLAPGDKVLLYTDGIEAASFENHPPGAASLLACAARHRELAVDPFVECLARDLDGSPPAGDDLTLLGLELTA